jgi:hypothetical protein
MPKSGSGFATGDEHYVVVIGREEEVEAPWQTAQPVRIGNVDRLIGKDLHDIPENRREQADVDPPGDAIGCPYPGAGLTEADSQR